MNNGLKILTSRESEIRALDENEILDISINNGLEISRTDRKTGQGQSFWFDYDGRLMKGTGYPDLSTQLELFTKTLNNIHLEKGYLTFGDVASSLKGGPPKDGIEEIIRSLDNNLFNKVSNRHNGRKDYRTKCSLEDIKTVKYTKLDQDKKRAFIENAYSLSREVYETLDGNLDGRIGILFDRVVNNNLETLENDARKVSSLYSKIGVLPPFLYDTVIVQLTEGCAWNKCNFCDLYKEEPFKIKTLEELKEHVDKIKNHFGESLILRNSIFLGSASALMIPQETLLPMLDYVVEEILKETNLSYNYGLNSFLDVRSALKKSIEEYKEISKRRVRAIYLGIESGSNEILDDLNKPHTKEEAIEAINNIKEAGLYVGLIFLVGLDGNHLKETKDLLNKVKIEYPDSVFLSKLIPNEETEGKLEIDPEFTEKQMFEFYKFLKQKQDRTELRSFNVNEYEIENFFLQ